MRLQLALFVQPVAGPACGSAGKFAEAVRDHFLNERIEYYKELEDAIANAAAADGMDMCTQDVKAGLLHLDPDLADHTHSYKRTF